MLKKSHRALSISLLPLVFIPIPLIKSTSFSLINSTITNYNNFIDLKLVMDPLYILVLIISLIVFFIGSTFPDLDKHLKIFVNKEEKNLRYLYHRQFTHGLILSFGLLFYSLSYLYADIGYYAYILMAFSLGIITHQIGDMLTGSIPILIYAPYYIRFARLGITVFLPKFLHKYFTEKLPKFINSNLKKIFIPLFILNLFLLYYFRYTVHI